VPLQFCRILGRRRRREILRFRERQRGGQGVGQKKKCLGPGRKFRGSEGRGRRVTEKKRGEREPASLHGAISRGEQRKHFEGGKKKERLTKSLNRKEKAI